MGLQHLVPASDDDVFLARLQGPEQRFGGAVVAKLDVKALVGEVPLCLRHVPRGELNVRGVGETDGESDRLLGFRGLGRRVWLIDVTGARAEERARAEGGDQRDGAA